MKFQMKVKSFCSIFFLHYYRAIFFICIIMQLDSLKHFLQKSSTLPKVIVIYGPTACGKTGLSIEVAKFLETEIISTDSRQIFRGMDIGTGKITETEKRGIVHHMLDIVTPDQEYTVADFKQEAERHIADIVAR